jgi:hypothetical protein
VKAQASAWVYPAPAHRSWTFAAVCVVVPALPLLVFNLANPIIQLLPWYAAVYLLIGACIFGPTGKIPSVRQAVAFLLPGALLVPLALFNVGFWAGGWLSGDLHLQRQLADLQPLPVPPADHPAHPPGMPREWGPATAGRLGGVTGRGRGLGVLHNPDSGGRMGVALDLCRRCSDCQADDRVLDKGLPPPIAADQAP